MTVRGAKKVETGPSPARAAASAPQDDRGADDKRIPRTRVRAGALAAALKDVAAALETRNTIPILDDVLIEVSDGRIVLTGTDLDLWLRRDLASDDGGQADSAEWKAGSRGFALCLPGKKLAQAVAALDPDAMVTLTAPHASSSPGGGDETRATLSAGRTRFRLSALAAVDFPRPLPLEAATSWSVPVSALGDMFGAVDHAVSSGQTRYYLNGVYWHISAPAAGAPGPDLRLVATDGSRLARLSVAAPEGALTMPPAIVPKKAVGLLGQLLVAALKAAPENSTPEVWVEASAERLRFTLPAGDGGEVTLETKTIDGDYPDYARVIPAAPAARAAIDRAALSAALKRVGVLGGENSRAVRADFARDPGSLSAAGQLTLTVTNAEIGEATEALACDYSGKALTLGFNGEFLRAALLALACDSVAFGLPDDPLGPVLLRGFDSGTGEEDERLVQVLMPMRV